MRIQGITIPDKKRLEISLTAIFGIGRSRAKEILTEAGLDHGAKAPDLSTAQEAQVRELVEQHTIEGDLRRDISGNIKRLKDIGSYRGKRHGLSVPTRGQRSKTNSRTRRGNVRKTMGTGRRAVDKK